MTIQHLVIPLAPATRSNPTGVRVLPDPNSVGRCIRTANLPGRQDFRTRLVNATLVAFDGQRNRGVTGASFDISGAIDRVTGQTEVDWMYERVGSNSHWELTCRPANRMF